LKRYDIAQAVLLGVFLGAKEPNGLGKMVVSLNLDLIDW